MTYYSNMLCQASTWDWFLGLSMAQKAIANCALVGQAKYGGPKLGRKPIWSPRHLYHSHITQSLKLS